MTFRQAIDEFMRDQQSAGRINSEPTRKRYLHTLWAHADDVDNRSPHTTNRNDVKRTLRRWPHPNTQRTSRSVLVSFYRWCVEEGIRPNNPAEQTRRPKRKPSQVYRLTREEAARMLGACDTMIERRAIHLGVLAGLRSAELRGLQGRHFRRPGFVWVSPDIAKGARERWVPVLAELAETWQEIARSLSDDEYVLPAQRWRDPGTNKQQASLAHKPMSAQGLYYLVGRVAKRAGITAHIHPHLLRHAYGDHIAKHAGLIIAQAMLGHASVETTRAYVGQITLDDLAEALAGFQFGYPPTGEPISPAEARTGIEPVKTPTHVLVGVLADLRRYFQGLEVPDA
jgi:integrase